MRGAVLHGPGDVRLELRDDPRLIEPTDAIIRLSATCVCGSDLWPYRGIEPVQGPAPMGHEYVGIVEEVGSAVSTITPGQFVIGSFFASDNTCEICQAGCQSSCIHREPMGTIGTQAELARVPLADGTLVATPDLPPADLMTSSSPARRCSSPTSTCTAVPRRCAASCPSWSTSSGTARSNRARSSTSSCPSTRSPRATVPWTSAAPSRPCSGPEPAG